MCFAGLMNRIVRICSRFERIERIQNRRKQQQHQQQRVRAVSKKSNSKYHSKSRSDDVNINTYRVHSQHADFFYRYSCERVCVRALSFFLLLDVLLILIGPSRRNKGNEFLIT